MKVTIEEDKLVFRLNFVENHKAKSVGARWHPSSKTWRVKLTKIAAASVVNNFKEGEYDPEIADLAGESVEIPQMSIDPNALIRGEGSDGKPIRLSKTQINGILKAWPVPGFAFFWVMGAGKTLATIALANLRRSHGLIDRLLIIAPTSIKGVWVKEFDRYSALPHHIFVMESGGAPPALWNEFPIMVVGVEALSQGGAFDVAKEFVAGGRCMVALDESSTIKNHDATRTERSWELGEESLFRLILTGTNVTQGLQDLYGQMRFVDPTIIGELSYYTFRNKYCVMGGFEERKIVGYKNVDQLLDKIRPFCDVIKEVEGLPDKMYQTRVVKASALQHRMCKELAKDMATEYGSGIISVQNTLEAMLRFQQIAGGFDPEGNPLPTNPKMAELLSLLDEWSGKAIIWARYLPEVRGIAAALEKNQPGSTMVITGEVPPPMRQPMVDEFEVSKEKRWLVVNQQTCGKGLTILAPKLSIYYSNTFSLEDRLQSEKRNHRIGQTESVMYVDLQSDLKVDRMVLTALQNKLDVSEYVNNGLRVTDLL